MASENEVGNVLRKTGKHDLPSSQEWILGGWPSSVVLALHTLTHSCTALCASATIARSSYSPQQKEQTSSPLFPLQQHILHPQHDLLPSTLRHFKSFSDKSVWRPESPAWKILQVWASNWFPCCAAEGLQGWVSPKVLVSISFCPAVTSA